MTALPPGAVIGVLGGGQLGRMLALAGASLGFDVHVFTPEPDGPAQRVAAKTTVAPYDDLAAAAAFAQACDAVTYEFENVPLETARAAAEHAPLRPGLAPLEKTQDRLVEKTFARALGVETVAFTPVDAPDALVPALADLGAPAILKARRDGYDGKGQTRITAADTERSDWAARAFAEAGGAASILEAVAPFRRELSIIAARGLDGSSVRYEMSENRHHGGVLRDARAPAPALAAETAARAGAIADAMLAALDYVGVLAIEFFELDDGRLLMNEFAPRVHNSGHWTMDACVCGQFEMHMRAVAGWPLGDPTRTAPVVMENLFGDDVLAAPRLAAEPGAHVHVYGKRELTPGRKTGHVNRVG